MDKIRDLREKFFLVDDEYLNGYAKLCGINATGVYLSMCRHSNKQQQCFPSKKLISVELSISERSVYTAIKKLEEWNIIKIEQQGRKENGSFKNLLYTLLSKTEWKTKPSAIGAVGKDCIPPSANNDISRRQVVPNKETHSEGNTYKETHTSSSASAGGKDINDLIKKFEPINPSYERLYPNKNQRSALERMVKKWGVEKVGGMIDQLPQIICQEYAPKPTTPIQLEEKLGAIKAFLDTHKEKTKSKLIIL